MNASLLAGDHNNIIGGIGKIINHPENRHGLVMPLIPGDFKRLGNPPDFKTLTRDVYPDDKFFSLEFIVNVLKDISSAMSHCHERGIMHGDIYAHNILTNEKGESFIGDFGTASLYDPESKNAELREKIDVRGFGNLIDDLLSRSNENDNNEILVKLQNLKRSCLNIDPIKRPEFVEILDLLNN
jgi:tRNA A-37 threonylcarbamoyl transferase component Bud32